MQAPSQGQWWSKCATQRSHARQCFERRGFGARHEWQYAPVKRRAPGCGGGKWSFGESMGEHGAGTLGAGSGAGTGIGRDAGTWC